MFSVFRSSLKQPFSLLGTSSQAFLCHGNTTVHFACRTIPVQIVHAGLVQATLCWLVDSHTESGSFIS